MKAIKYLSYALFCGAALSLGSCADDSVLGFSVDKPEGMDSLEYLNQYNPLKTYVNRTTDPNFKLGCGVTASDFPSAALPYRLAVTNFDEVVAGNAMKYASCVKDDGSMDFSQVQEFVTAAQDAGVNVYGHCLGWHAQQNLRYLNGLIADRVISTDPDDIEDIEDKYVDYSTFTSFPYYVMGYTPEFEDGCMVSHYPGEWYQYFVADGITTEIGQSYKVTVCMQGSTAGQLNVQFGNWGNLLEKTLYFTDQMQEITIEFDNCPVESSFVVFQPGTYVGDIKIKWLKVSHASPNVQPLTPEEKKDTLSMAMANWIDGMMEATQGAVTAWDAINEAISGGDNDGDGYYDLQHAATTDPTDAANNFYWQDYLGDLDYVRYVIADARKSFAAHGGDPSQLKLFINDYNLESTWDNNMKARSMVHWIQQWESDGVTHIDGIGTQMHISYNLDSIAQKRQEQAVDSMFAILARSGKLIRVSELDMGINDVNGQSIPTTQVTVAQQKKMAEFYTYIINSYFRYVPAAQRYGITQWCITDSPAGSGWRPGEPVGLWNESYQRKPQYEGYVKGLQSVQVTN